MTGDESSQPKPPQSVRDSMAGADRPTPVRDVMDSGREQAETVEVPEVRVTRGEEEWIVRVEGRATARAGSKSGTPLLFLTFARASMPEAPVYEALRVGRRLDTLSEAELLDALETAGPYRKDWTPHDLFAGTRRQKGAG